MATIELSKLNNRTLENSITPQQAKALGDPTRYKIFRHIADAEQYTYVEELTSLLKLNHNAIRQHLAILKEAGLVTENIESRSARGRPRLQYQLSDHAYSLLETDGPYHMLAILLAEVVKTKTSPRDIGQQAGRAMAISKAEDFEAIRNFVGKRLSRDGFEPVPDNDQGFILERCPYADVASIDPTTVCQLHLGLLEGMTETGAPSKLRIELIAKNPYKAKCKVLMTESRDS